MVDGLLDGLLLGGLLGEPPLAPEDGLDGLLEDGEDGDELVPEDGAVLLGERVAELEPLLPDEPLWPLEPELSQAASDKAESTAAAISHFLSIRLSPFGLRFLGGGQSFLLGFTPGKQSAAVKNSLSDFSHSAPAHRGNAAVEHLGVNAPHSGWRGRCRER